MTNAGLSGRIGSGKSHIVPMSCFFGTDWFDDGGVASETPRRRSLLCNSKLICNVIIGITLGVASSVCAATIELPVSTEEEALAFLTSEKKKYPDDLILFSRSVLRFLKLRMHYFLKTFCGQVYCKTADALLR